MKVSCVFSFLRGWLLAVSDGHGSVQEGYYIDSAPDFEDRRGVWRRGSAIERFNGGLVGCCSIFLLALRATFLLRWAEQKAAPEWFKLRQGQHRHVDALSRPHLMSRGCDQLPPLTIPRHSKVIPAWMSWLARNRSRYKALSQADASRECARADSRSGQADPM